MLNPDTVAIVEGLSASAPSKMESSLLLLGYAANLVLAAFIVLAGLEMESHT